MSCDFRFSAVALALLAACVHGPSRRGAPLDLKIVHGRLVDGTGAPWFRGDLGIRGDEIVAMGELSDRPARATIDAKDQVVAPGFIDLLSQSEDTVLVDPSLETKVRQGVTTQITGEGRTPGPIDDAMVAEDLREAPESKPKPWRTLGGYFDVLEKNRTALNFGIFVGEANLRQVVVGEANRDPSPEELKRMEALLEQAMKEGALGLSTALVYVPDTYSKTEELIALARVAAKRGGVYFSHIRNESDEIVSALDEIARIGREADIPVNIWHLKVSGRKNAGRMAGLVERIAKEREAGVDIAANVYPYVASSTALAALLPSWALEGSYQAMLDRLKDPATRARIAKETREPGPHGFLDRIGGASSVLVTDIQNKAFAKYQKKLLSDIAKEMQVDPVEAAFRLLESSTLSPDAVYFSMDEGDLRTALKQPWVSVGADSAVAMSQHHDEGIHPRAYGTFPRILGRYVRDEHVLTLEDAVRKMTSLAANRVKLWDRGLLRPGKKADVVIFDPQTIKDLSTYEDPHQLSVGVADLIVNGQPVLLDGKLTGNLPGRVLRGPGSATPR